MVFQLLDGMDWKNQIKYRVEMTLSRKMSDGILQSQWHINVQMK